MSRKNESGFIGVLLAIVAIMLIIGFFWLISCIRWESSEQNVSGIAYNVTNDNLVSGSTQFSVRASVDTYIYHNKDGSTNESSYCLPKGSPYIALVNKAAADKNVKIIVTTKKMFYVAASPWVCADNVVVTEGK